jgi:hypothetical protein
MAGKIKQMLDTIVRVRGKGNATHIAATRAKLILKGLSPDRFGPDSPDDPYVLNKVRDTARELGVEL